MEKKLNGVLNETEKVLWFGQPIKSKLLQGPDKTFQYTAWGVTAALFLFCFAFFVPSSIAQGRDTGATVIAIVVLNSIPLIIALRPYLDQRLLERNTIYAITDRRVIAIVKDTVMALPRHGLEIDVNGREGANGNLCFNKGVTAPLKKSRSNAIMGCRGEGNQIEGIIFYHIDSPDKVKRILTAA